MDIGLKLLASLGHLWVMIFLVNRLHSLAIPHRIIKSIDSVWYLVTLGIPIVLFADLIFPASFPRWLIDLQPGLLIYGWGAAAMTLLRWIGRKLFLHETNLLLSDNSESIDAVDELGFVPAGSASARIAPYVPGNQVYQIAIHEKELRLPHLPPALDGITITHLSDLHFTGRVTKPFYELIVELSNQRPSDLVVITGDIIDKRQCFDWLGDVLGKLEANHSCYFVLGNHDLRVHDEARVRDRLTEQNLIDVGKSWQQITLRNHPVVLVGNERPWFSPAGDLTTRPPELADAFHIGLVHTPDQLSWARANGIDLCLAGHTHGGQVRLPIIGPVFSPSRHGVKYCGGAFYKDPTLLHVSRGLSGTRPLRINCPPELARLTLRANPVGRS